MIEKWNAKAKSWFKVQIPTKLDGEKKNQALVKTMASVYSNLASAVDVDKTCAKDLDDFTKSWKGWAQEVSKQGYEVSPVDLANLASPVGQIIYLCSPRNIKSPNILVRPGLKHNGKMILQPISAVVLPVNTPFPNNHPYSKLPACWRGILGEMELLMTHIEMQRGVVCGIESINKVALIPVLKERTAIVEEIKRRQKAMQDAIEKKLSAYEMATNYWRVEECFWGLFHDDDRPKGYSFFDILRMRAQDWRAVIRKDYHINVQDFIPRRDTVASVNKYIGGMILKKQAGMASGVILRQIRPAVILKEKGSDRVLKGRAIST